jgi:VanZ family protein
MPLPKPLIRRSILLLWMASATLVTYLSIYPSLEIPGDFIDADKIVHFLAYLWLAALPFFAFQIPKTALTGAVSMVPLSFVLEIVQHYVPGRCFSVADLVANCLGVMVGIWLARSAKRFHSGRTNHS